MSDHQHLERVFALPLGGMQAEYRDVVDASECARRERRFGELASLLVDRELIAAEIDRRIAQLFPEL